MQRQASAEERSQLSTGASSMKGPPGTTAAGEATSARLRSSDWTRACRDAFVQFRRHRDTLVAGSLAYNWFLALFPALIALIAIVALLHLPEHTVHTLINGTTKALPPGASGVVGTAVQHAGKETGGALATTVLASAVAVWSASSGMASLQTGLNIVHDIPQADSRKFLKSRAVALVMMVAAVVLGGLAAALVVFGAPLGFLLSHYVPVGKSAFDIGWTVVRWVVAVVLVGVLFSVLYYLGPSREKPRWQWLSGGGLLGAAIWLAASLGFSYYVSSFGSYGKTYGALAGVVVLIFWLYLTGLAVVFGAEINAGLERRRADLANPPAEEPSPSASGGRLVGPA